MRDLAIPIIEETPENTPFINEPIVEGGYWRYNENRCSGWEPCEEGEETRANHDCGHDAHREVIITKDEL